MHLDLLLNTLTVLIVQFFAMYSQTKFLTFFLAALVIFPSTIMLVNAQAKLTNQSKVFINGIGPIRMGMTVAQASQAAATRLVSLNNAAINNKGCFYVKPQGEPNDVEFMLTDGSISRVEVLRNSRVTTRIGARIGDTEARIKSLYPGQIQVTQHKYVPGWHYLTFVPRDSFDRNYRLVFETNGNRVIQFRAGKLPEVEYVERCG